MPLLRTLRHPLVSLLWDESTPKPDVPKPNTLTGLPSELLLSVADTLFPMDLLATPPFSCFNDERYYYVRRQNVRMVRLRHVWYQFCFIHLQLAIKRFCHGPPFEISNECLLALKINSSESISSLFSADAAICPEPLGLCLRFTDVMLVHSQHVDLLSTRPESKHLPGPPQMWYICTHISARKFTNFVNSAVQAYLSVQTAPHDSTTRSAMTCIHCRTEALIEFYRDVADMVLALTRWINLDPELSPGDPQWKIRRTSRRVDDEEEVTLDLWDLKASSRTCFGLGSSRYLDSLRASNAFDLSRHLRHT